MNSVQTTILPASAPSIAHNSMEKSMDAVFKSSSLTLLKAKQGERPSGFLEGARRVLHYMHELWTTGRMCDVTLDCDGGQLRAHKIAMSAYSDLLTRRFMEYPIGEQVNINVKEFRRDTVYSILAFLYTTDLNVTQDNVGEMLSLASELGLTFIRQTCIEFLKYLTPDNVLLYLEIAEKHNLTDILAMIQNFLRGNFAQIMSSPYLVKISADKLMMLLSSDRRNIPGGELEVFCLVVRWVDHNRPERLPLAAHMMRLVYLNKISPLDLVNQVEKVDFMVNLRECFHQLYVAMSFHVMQKSGLQTPPQPQPQASYPMPAASASFSGSILPPVTVTGLFTPSNPPVNNAQQSQNMQPSSSTPAFTNPPVSSAQQSQSVQPSRSILKFTNPLVSNAQQMPRMQPSNQGPAFGNSSATNTRHVQFQDTQPRSNWADSNNYNATVPTMASAVASAAVSQNNRPLYN